MPFTKPNKGSVLVFSLIVLSIVLSIVLFAALSVAVVNVSNRKSAGSTGQSVQSFQVADSGVELMLKKIYKDPTNVALSSLGTACTSGVVSTSVSGGLVRVSFFDDANAQVTDCASTTWRESLAKIKVEGTSAGTTRVIETAVAAASIPSGTLCGTSFYEGNSVAIYTGNLQQPAKCNGVDVLKNDATSNCPVGFTLVRIGYSKDVGLSLTYNQFSCAKN